MSLTSFIRQPEVRDRLKTVRPKLPKKSPASMKAAPRTRNAWMVGVAFDYFLRFEIQRRARHAQVKPWVASATPDIIRDNYEDWFPPRPEEDEFETEKRGEEAAKYAANAAKAAESAVAKYVLNNCPTPATQAELASHAI